MSPPLSTSRQRAVLFSFAHGPGIFLGTQIDDQVANAVITAAFLQQEDAEKDSMYINSLLVL